MSNILAPDFMECLIKCLWHNELIGFHLIRLTINNEETHCTALYLLYFDYGMYGNQDCLFGNSSQIKLFHLGHNMTHNVCILTMHATNYILI